MRDLHRWHIQGMNPKEEKGEGLNTHTHQCEAKTSCNDSQSKSNRWDNVSHPNSSGLREKTIGPSGCFRKPSSGESQRSGVSEDNHPSPEETKGFRRWTWRRKVSSTNIVTHDTVYEKVDTLAANDMRRLILDYIRNNPQIAYHVHRV